MFNRDLLTNVLGFLGFTIPLLVLIYLLLKVFGVIHSPSLEETLIVIAIGQVFYSGYTHRALQDIDRRLKQLEKKLK